MLRYACSLVFLSVALCKTLDSSLAFDRFFDNNFESVDTLGDGEYEKRIVWNGIAAKETKAKKQNGEELKLVQVTDGSHLLQLIYFNEELQDCEHLMDGESVTKFINEFKDDELKVKFMSLNPDVTGDTKNISQKLLQDRPIDPTINLHYLRKQCKEKHEQIREGAHKSRNKRSLGSDLFRMPSTQWCGSGYDAKNYKDVGGYLGTDRCCRDHDLKCPYYITAWETKYGITNWMFYTLSHCNCDEKFRTCLKRTNTGASHLVGKLFFNIAQTKCFIFKPEKVCARSSWWGKCQKWTYKKIPVLKDPLTY